VIAGRGDYARRNDNFSKLYINLTVTGGETNGLNLDESPSITNYTETLDTALRYLIEAQDLQSPITN
jgi:hypothetical protein